MSPDDIIMEHDDIINAPDDVIHHSDNYAPLLCPFLIFLFSIQSIREEH